MLRAAGETTRARILALLTHGELSVGELAQVLNISQPRLSRQVKFLADSGLVDRVPEGGWVFYRLSRTAAVHEMFASLLTGLDPEDPHLKRDRARLQEARAARAAAASEYFARVAPQWDELRARHYPEAEIEQAMLAFAGPRRYASAIDFGTGAGRMLTLFARRADRLEGIDLSRQMLALARTRLSAAGVENASVRLADATAAPFPDQTFDLAILHQVLHYLDEPARAVQEAARVLQPGGRLIVVDFAPHDVEELRSEHAHRYLGFSDADLTSWITGAGLEVRGHRRFDPPGTRDGMVAVTLIAADRPPLPHSGSA